MANTHETKQVDIQGWRMLTISEIVFGLGLAKSKSEARRLIEQGGIRIEGEKVAADDKVALVDFFGKVFQRGRRQFVKLVPGEPEWRTLDSWEFDTDEEGDAFAKSLD